MKQYGIDEAGLGPMLGPYCLGYTKFKCEKKTDLFDSLKSCVSSLPDPDKLVIGDSKRLYSQRKGIGILEESVLALFYMVNESIPDCFSDFIKELSGIEMNKEYSDLSWFSSAFDFKLPLSADIQQIIKKAEKVKKEAENKKISLNKLALRWIPAREFNHQLDVTGNKSIFCLNQVAFFINPDEEESLYHIDRQGGRTKYGDWLITAFPGKRLQAFEEGKQRSRYRIENSEILFSVGSDDTYLETAAASLIAKYARELSMKAFNDYWKSIIPDLKKTAGYVSDGRRFIADLKEVNCLPANIDILVRKK